MKKFLFFVVVLVITGITSWAQNPLGNDSHVSDPSPVSSSCLPVTQFPWFEGFEVAFPSAVAPLVSQMSDADFGGTSE
jgi:hypothetical protein